MLTPRTDKTLCKNYPPEASDLPKPGPAISKCRALPVPIVNCIRLARREESGHAEDYYNTVQTHLSLAKDTLATPLCTQSEASTPSLSSVDCIINISGFDLW